jgi:hypothetical protein
MTLPLHIFPGHPCRYDEARQAYTAAGQPHLAAGILQELRECSIVLKCYKDTGYYCYQMAMEELLVCISSNLYLRLVPLAADWFE